MHSKRLDLKRKVDASSLASGRVELEIDRAKIMSFVPIAIRIARNYSLVRTGIIMI